MSKVVFFLPVFLLAVTAICDRIQQIDDGPKLIETDTCAHFPRKVKIENDDGCVGEYTSLSCSGVCPSYEIPIFSKERM